MSSSQLIRFLMGPCEVTEHKGDARVTLMHVIEAIDDGNEDEEASEFAAFYCAFACASPAEPAAMARITQWICSERKPVENPMMGTAMASRRFTIASFLWWQYHRPAPGSTRLNSDAFVVRLIPTSD